MQTSEVLNLAADSLEQDGWQQNASGDPGGPRCILGALRGVLGETTFLSLTMDVPAYRALREHLGEYVSDWNDAPGRTVDDVVSTLRTVAANTDERLTVSA